MNTSIATIVGATILAIGIALSGGIYVVIREGPVRYNKFTGNVEYYSAQQKQFEPVGE